MMTSLESPSGVLLLALLVLVLLLVLLRTLRMAKPFKASDNSWVLFNPGEPASAPGIYMEVDGEGFAMPRAFSVFITHRGQVLPKPRQLRAFWRRVGP